MKKLEIMARTVEVQLNNEDKLGVRYGFKQHIFKQMKRGRKSGVLQNAKMKVVGEWRVKDLFFNGGENDKNI